MWQVAHVRGWSRHAASSKRPTCAPVNCVLCSRLAAVITFVLGAGAGCCAMGWKVGGDWGDWEGVNCGWEGANCDGWAAVGCGTDTGPVWGALDGVDHSVQLAPRHVLPGLHAGESARLG